jgi:8-oxo-dGTP pyrophosphatase MutT (NUDIX family)
MIGNANTLRAYPAEMTLQKLLGVRLSRWGYRVAYLLLRIYWFLRRPSLRGVKCVLTDGERVLLVRHTYGPSDWVMPGGAIKPREEPLLAAQREMHEELGVRIENWKALGVLTGRMDYRRDTLHCWQAELGNRELTLERAEIDDARWFARDQMPDDIGAYVLGILELLPPPATPTQ